MTALILNFKLQRAREKIIMALETGAPSTRVSELRCRAYEVWQDVQRVARG